MPTLLILLSTLGGLFLFGAVGFIVGPIVAAVFMTVWTLYGEAFREWLPQVEPVPLATPAGTGVAAGAAGEDAP
jgi:predicted PurR-regulated permease PerM